jgi:hypothetical protein
MYPIRKTTRETEEGLQDVMQGRDDTHGYQFWLGTGNGNKVRMASYLTS